MRICARCGETVRGRDVRQDRAGLRVCSRCDPKLFAEPRITFGEDDAEQEESLPGFVASFLLALFMLFLGALTGYLLASK